MTTYALVDGNAFYASCQIAFQPALKNRPVVVLSNNDGCIVAANHLAKQLNQTLQQPFGQGGYRAAQPHSIMFQPYFKVAPLLKKCNAAIFSSNYELYADMSMRMHTILGQFASRQEIYSIDESFLDFSDQPTANITATAHSMKHQIQQSLGLPVAVGIGANKTLAKLANHLAKKQTRFNGVLHFSALSETHQDLLLKQVQVGEIWGVGRALSKQLEVKNILNACDLKHYDSQSLRRQFSVNLERTQRELKGQLCFAFNENSHTPQLNKQQIISSRSFGQLVTEYEEMRQAVANYTAVAAEKLRRQGAVCQVLSLAITTPPHRQQLAQYKNQISVPLIYPSDNTLLLTKLAVKALKQIWRPGFHYLKATVMLANLSEKGALQLDLFAQKPQFSANPKADRLMQTMDSVNQKMGRGALQLASSGLQQPNWKMNRNLMSPRYTTRWEELLVVKAN